MLQGSAVCWPRRIQLSGAASLTLGFRWGLLHVNLQLNRALRVLFSRDSSMYLVGVAHYVCGNVSLGVAFLL